MARRNCFSEEERQSVIDRHRSDVVYQRQQKLLGEANRWGQISSDNRLKYLAVLAPYDGKKLIDIPRDVIEKAESFLKAAQYADRKWDECMRKVDNQ